MLLGNRYIEKMAMRFESCNLSVARGDIKRIVEYYFLL